MARTGFLAKQWWWDVRANLFVRPMVIVVAHILLASVLVGWEHQYGPVKWLSTEPAAAQTVLSTLAGAMMTVVSVVYSILLVALSLASMPFSTRILAGFVRDGTSQTVLGLFVGAFIYSLLVLRSVHTEPSPFVPGLAFSVAIGLALFSLGSLLYFIHRIIQLIQANHLVDGLATDAEPIIDEVFPSLGPAVHEPPPPQAAGAPVLALRSGYIQLVDVEALVALAGASDIRLLRPMGGFVVEGTPLFMVSPPEDAEALGNRLRECVDLGATRTLQADAEYGVRQIVDIALKAISPAINDPSTAATCIDHLSRLLVRAATRGAPPSVYPSVNGRFVLQATSFSDLLDLTLEQLRQYGKTDMAVALRLLRLLTVVTGAIRHLSWLDRVEHHMTLIVSAARQNFAKADSEELERRVAEMERLLRDRRSDVRA